MRISTVYSVVVATAVGHAPTCDRGTQQCEGATVDTVPVLLQKKQQLSVATQEEEVAALEAAVDEEMRRENAGYKARSKLAYEHDIREMPRSSFLQYKHERDLPGNAEASFNDFCENHPEIVDALTKKEKIAWKKRFMELVVAEIKHRDNPQMTDVLWKEIIAEALEEMKPVATQALCDAINSGESGMMKAKCEDWMDAISNEEYQNMQGLHAEDENRVLLSMKRGLVRDRLTGKRRVRQLPSNFDTRTQWPHCESTIMHVRDQGMCGSCWAFAAATAADGRFCVASGGAFSGPHAFVSAGFMASCTPQHADGCQGGDPKNALVMMANSGVPTGFTDSSTSETAGCVPYFATGDAAHHFSGASFSSPACYDTSSTSDACPRTDHPRNLDQDKFYATGWSGVGHTFSPDSVKQYLVSGGPVPIAILANSDFMVYASGVYHPGCDAQANHAVTAIGYSDGIETGEGDHFIVLNSYGKGWGNQGSFKLKQCGVSWGYSIPTLTQDTSSGPYPLPSGPVSPPSDEVPDGSVPDVPPDPNAMVTQDNCECRRDWCFSGECCSDYCCQIADVAPWCFTVDETCAGSNWGYCQDSNPEPNPEPTPEPEPSPTASPEPDSGVPGTEMGCLCANPQWTYGGVTCNSYCCNPDNDVNGDWCFTQTGCSRNWDYCVDGPAPSPDPEPAPSPTPSPDGCVPLHSLPNDCTNCLDSDQCGEGGFCCPYMKKCVSSSSQGCYPPIAECSPVCYTAECTTCQNADYGVGSWQLPTCSDDGTPPVVTTQAPQPVVTTQAPQPVVTTQAPQPVATTQAPGPMGRVTTNHCPCQQTWQFKGSPDIVDYCGNPDGDAGGEWCFVQDSSCEGQNWGHCATNPEPVPGPGPAPAPAVAWTTISGSCAIDTLGCATSPNFPAPYGKDQSCEISAGTGGLPISVKSFSTELNYDFLEVNNVKYWGTAGPVGVQATGTIKWSADFMVEMPGWKICPDGQLQSAPAPSPAPSRRRFSHTR